VYAGQERKMYAGVLQSIKKTIPEKLLRIGFFVFISTKITSNPTKEGLKSYSRQVLNAIKMMATVLSLNQQTNPIASIPVLGRSEYLYRTTIQQILEKHEKVAL
jgi:hypothetical protein